MALNKMFVQLTENGEVEYRIRKLNIKAYDCQSDLGDHAESKAYMDIIHPIDNPSCSGLHFSDTEKTSKSFESFSQSSVHDFRERLANCEVLKEIGSRKCQQILSILISAYTKETLLEFKARHPTLVIHRCLAFSKQNHILFLELVRSYIFDFDLRKLNEEKELNYVVMDTFLTTAKYMILKQYPMLKPNVIRLSFCFKCSPESRLVIMMINKESIEIKYGIPEKVMGVELVPFNCTQSSEEASAVFNTITASCLSENLPVITEKDARKLFKKHSNLTLISASPYKSSGYSKGKHIIVEKHCIRLLCLHKGYIPFGEREFQKQINGFEVDVQEGYCSLGRSIDLGGHIRRAKGINNPASGTIGGFVDLPNGSVGLITCAHVVLSSDELKIPNTELMNYVLARGTDLDVESFDKNQQKFQVCGKIINKCFPLSPDDNSVDAALIQLDPSVTEFVFPVTDQLYSTVLGFDQNRPTIFTGGVVNVPDPDPILKVGSRIPGILDSVVKYGSKSGFTIGNLYFNGAHIRFVDDIGEPPDKSSVDMYNQIEIQSLPHGKFLEVGDSGAFVFCVNPDKTLSCLGMAIGITTKGSCLVTPMARILDSFGLPRRLKSCLYKVPLKSDTDGLKEFLRNEKITVSHARGILVGCTGAGKTTLLKQLRGKPQILNEVTESTMGLEVHQHVFFVKNGILEVTEDESVLKAFIRINSSDLKRDPRSTTDISDPNEKGDNQGLKSADKGTEVIYSREEENLETDSTPTEGTEKEMTVERMTGILSLEEKK